MWHFSNYVFATSVRDKKHEVLVCVTSRYDMHDKINPSYVVFCFQEIYENGFKLKYLPVLINLSSVLQLVHVY